MPLRNGKKYLISHHCQKCHTFYSHELYDYTCSYCAGHAPTTPRTDPSPELIEWVEKNTLDKSNQPAATFLTQLKRIDNSRLFIILSKLRQREQLLKADDALTLLEDQNNITRGHIVASSVADWWNIKTRDVGGNWFGYLVCYYGNFDSKFPPRKLPPRPPHALLSCTNTLHLFNFIEN